MIEIKPQKIKTAKVAVPGSKSLTHRILICAALSDGVCFIHNALDSDDTRLTRGALKQMGIKIDARKEPLVMHGENGVLRPCREPVYLGNSGTSMRLLAAVASLGQGKYRLTGTERMGERPIQDLLDGLIQIGVRADSVEKNGCPPLDIQGGKVRGGKVALKCGTSSQFLSALLLMAPCTEKGLEIHVTEGPVSRPYIDLTIDVMNNFGVSVQRDGYSHFKIDPGQTYSAGAYVVEPDCSQAGYFWAAAAIAGTRVKVKNITKKSRQGDLRFAEILEAMGCSVVYDNDGILVVGSGSL
ncbi:MAG: 3-phosphoshikimate 1-carboxyvinyltransferase, partial [Deltaproteobacteria bacterium]|nr:3-phosphoshikimate 1-carboxyvinyltransferase [Deltaproteobacteria bacterium]